MTAGGRQAPSSLADDLMQQQAARELHHSSKRAKARLRAEGVDTGGSRVLKSRRTSELSVERVELGHVLVGAALH